MDKKERLAELYANQSKHSNYQLLPTAIMELLPSSAVKTESRCEPERMKFLNDNIDFTDKSVLDIGGNTGYFTFEVLESGARDVLYIEGNKEHSEFVGMAADILNKSIEVQNRYFNFSSEESGKFDIALLFNVIHHLGDDFGDQSITMDEAKVQMQKAISSMADYADFMVLQMGFCWKGDRNKLLFPNGSKEEMIAFVKDSLDNRWEIVKIGVPQMVNGQLEYMPPSEENLKRDDALGEFRNRPIFLLNAIK